MSTTDILDRWQARRERKYANQLEQTQNWLPKWRNQKTRRRLVVALVTIFVLFPIFGVLILWGALGGGSMWIGGSPWLIATVAQVVLWTCLNITIDSVETAPASLLDEYERARMESLRSLAYKAFTWVGLVAVLGLVFLGTWLMVNEPDWAVYVPYSIGIFGLGIYLALISFPSLVIAWTMQDD